MQQGEAGGHRSGVVSSQPPPPFAGPLGQYPPPAPAPRRCVALRFDADENPQPSIVLHTSRTTEAALHACYGVELLLIIAFIRSEIVQWQMPKAHAVT